MHTKAICSAIVFLVVFFISGSGETGEARKRASDLKRESANDSVSAAEIRFGRELAARILGNYHLYDDEEANRYINLVGKGIARYAGGEIQEYYFGILDSEEVNAFAAPGGYVFITKGAVLKMENEAQLAAVLGHEIAHIMKRHVIKELDLHEDQGSAISGIAALIGGASGGLRETLDKTLSDAEDILFNKGYMIEDEIEADQTGIILSAMAGYHPGALKNFLTHAGSFEKVRAPKDGDHPVLQARIEKIDAVLAEHGLQHMQGRKVEERYYDYIKKIRY